VTTALHGNLREFGIGEVFQLIGQQRKTGVLEVRGEQGEVELRFDAGGVVSAAPAAERPDASLVEMLVRCGLVPRDRLAEIERDAAANEPLAARIVAGGLLGAGPLREIEDLLTRDTIFELLRWDHGSFRFVAQPIAHDRDADELLGAEQVLMDGLRMVDEWHAFADELPGEQVVFRSRGSLEEYRHSPAARTAPSLPETERVYLLVDGRANVRRVVDLSRLGTFPAMRVLVHLARSGWIEPVRARRDPELVATAAPERRRRFALVGPFALLLVLAGPAIWARRAPPSDGLDLRASALEKARAHAEVARWRALLVAHRLATGRWAGGLDEVAQWAGALTPSEAAHYVGQRAEGPVVLAPEIEPAVPDPGTLNQE